MTTTNYLTKTAQQTFDAQKIEVQRLLDLVAANVRNEPADIQGNYGYVGNMARLIEVLKEAAREND